ncbi:MAG: hypothetical protein JNL98_03015 [Bryobacterales bacterium]|nr:hypothetical protein [Bryobacterales bacterium]
MEVQFSTLLNYKPGSKQTITVRVYPRSDGGGQRGFQITARLASNESLQAGTFGITDISNTVLQTQDGIQYVNHSKAVGANSYAGTTAFTMEWTPPAANSGDIKFYAVAVDGPGDSIANALDAVYTASYTLRPDSRELPDGFRWTTLNVGTTTTPAGISNDGRITGTIQQSSATVGFVRSAAGEVTTFSVPGATATYPTAVNSAGTVVGYYINGNSRAQGFVRTAAGVISTRNVPNALSTELRGINDQGRISGTYSDTNLFARGFIFELNGDVTQVTASEGSTRVDGINSAGTVAGTFFQQGVLRQSDGYFFNALECGSSSSAYARGALNDFGDYLGQCIDPTATFLVPPPTFLRASNGRLARLARSIADAPSFTGINNTGQIVGRGNEGLLLVPCALTLTSNSITIDSAGGSGRVPYTGPADCIPAFTTDSSWIAVQGDGSFSVQASNNAVTRTGTIQLGSQVFTITQSAVACGYTFSGGINNPPAAGIASSVSVIAPTGCVWNAFSNVSWIRITSTSPNPGVGSGIINYTVDTNVTGFSRVGAIFVGGQQFLITQVGGSGCAYQVQSGTTSFSIDGGAGAVNVTTTLNCTWTVFTNETWIQVSSGFSTSGSATVNFVVSANTSGAARTGFIRVAGQDITISQAGPGSSAALRFVPITPCRLVDSRDANRSGSFGPPSLAAGTSRDIPVPQGACGIPFSARAYSVNMTVVPAGFLGFLSLYPTGQTRPVVSTLNSWNGRVVANAAIVPAGTSGAITVFASDNTHIVLDVNGYFVPASEPQGLMFYPVTPCRISDTRAGGGKLGEYGPPQIAAGGTRTMNVPASGCGIPGNAQAYALNVTAVPPGLLSYITVWPGGQTQPLASTLNAFDGQVVANAAIVPAGLNGTVSFFASEATDLVVDVTGYFAPPGAGASPLNFFTVTPCRAVDTRGDGGKSGQFGPPQMAAGSARSFGLLESGCGVPAAARAYSLNMTVVPPGPLSFLTTWPTGLAQPLVSTLNSFNGQVVANAALVPAGSAGAINVFVSNASDVIIDINGFFAP